MRANCLQVLYMSEQKCLLVVWCDLFQHSSRVLEVACVALGAERSSTSVLVTVEVGSREVAAEFTRSWKL